MVRFRVINNRTVPIDDSRKRRGGGLAVTIGIAVTVAATGGAVGVFGTGAIGRVREFLLAHPCRSLQRGSFSVAADRRNRAVLSVAWIEMSDARQAAELKDVLDAPGTGSIRPLDRRVRLTGQHYASGRDREIVTTAEAEPVVGRVEAAVLAALAQDASG